MRNVDRKRTKAPAGGSIVRKIAEELGFAPSTVSAILGTRAHLYPEATRNRVVEAARRLRYRPNALARATRTGRSGQIGMLVPRDRSHGNLSIALLTGVEEALTAVNAQLVLVQLPDDRQTDEGYVPRVLREWAVDGFLINYHYAIPPRVIELIRQHESPVIWVNSRQPADSVYPDEEEAGARAARYLIRQGHRRIAYVDYVHGTDSLAVEHFSTIDRPDGFERAMREAGLEPLMFRYPAKVAHGERVGLAREMLTMPDAPTAFVAYNATTGSTIFLAASLLGRDPTRELPIVTFGIDKMMLCAVHPTPTLIVPDAKMGQRVVEQLLAKIERPDVRLEPIRLPFDLEE